MESTDLIDISTDALEAFLVDTEARIGQVRAAQMAILVELDQRQVPTGDGCRTLSEWVAGRLDLAPESAHRLARTGRAFQDLPATRRALADGKVTFDRAAELARTATPATEEADLEDGARVDIAGLRRQAAHRRRLTSVDEHTAFEHRRIHLQPTLDESWYDIWGGLPGYHGRLFEKALQERADQLPTPQEPGSRAQRHADALVSIAQDSLTGTAAGEPSTPLITVFVDTSAIPTNSETGARIADGPRVGPATVERILCEGTVEVIARTEDGQPLAVGHASRSIRPKLRRFVLARDGGCTADGCTSRYRLQPHHRIPWSDGGPTDPVNLATLCWYHHHVVVHGRGYTIDTASPPTRIRFRAPVDTLQPP